MAPTDGMGVMQYQWNVRESVGTTEMLMPSNYLEMPELRLLRVFLDLAEEARNVKVENGLSCCSEEVQPQGTGFPRPVFVTVMVDSQPVPKKRVLRTTGASSEMMPNINCVGRCEPVDRSDQVGPPGTTEQQVLLGMKTDGKENAPVDPGGPDMNRPMAGCPVGRLFNLDPLGPSRMSSQDELNQPLAVGPVGRPFITGPLGDHVRASDCRRTNRINSDPEGSAGVLDPVNQTGIDIQTDRLNTGTINGPASSGDTPPSSNSGVHSWEEQWENMSEHSMEGASEQTDRSNYGSSVRGHMSNIRAPPNTEEEGDSDYPWADRLLSKESDGSSSNVVHHNDRRLLYNAVTGYGSDSSAANSGNLGRNSDIGALSEYPVVDVTGVS